MGTRLRSHVRANAVGYIALMVAVVGLPAAWAIGKNTVGTKQLKRNAVTTVKIKDGAVTTGKLADDAATGAKIAEGSLAQVPSAAVADNAANAANAANADRADNADNAANAALAADATQFTGLDLFQVRSFAFGVSSDPANISLTTSDTEVLATNVLVATGGGDLMVSASIRLFHNTVNDESQASCILEVDTGAGFVPIGQRAFADFPDQPTLAWDIQLPLTGFADNVPAAGVFSPHEVRIVCREDETPADIRFDRGDLSVLVVPIA